MKKLVQKLSPKQEVSHKKSVPVLKDRKALEAKVEAGTKKAIREYRETFRILTNYDRS